jgi:hypothetical protein
LSAGRRPIALAFLLLAAFSQAPYLRAWLDPPAGTRFVFAFHWIDDLYLYGSFIQQAESGRILFENKLYPEPHRRLYVNLELGLAGRTSALLGRQPLLALRLLGLIASLLVVIALDRLLQDAGLPEGRRLVSLLLVTLGGGTGGLLFLLTGRSAMEIRDLSVGLFLHTGLLANPHWVVAQALALWMLRAALRGRHVAFASLGTALGLVRPYDVALVACFYVVVTLCCEAPREWLRRLSLLLWLAPVALYNLALLTLAPAFGSYLRNPYAQMTLWSFAEPLGPAAVVAMLVRPWRGQDPARRRVLVALGAWAAVAVVAPALGARGASLQLLVCTGTPLLALAALGLARLRPWLTGLVLPCFLSTAAVAFWIVSGRGAWHAPAERYDAALALRPSCGGGGVVFAPADIGLYAAALTGCRAVLSHVVAPDYDERTQDVLGFYGNSTAEARAALLDRVCATHLVLPGDPGGEPTAWLGEARRFRRVASVGAASRRISLYARPPVPSCPSRN